MRKVAIIAPANFWRHLAAFDSKFKIDLDKSGDLLLCIKPVYMGSVMPRWHGNYACAGISKSKEGNRP